MKKILAKLVSQNRRYCLRTKSQTGDTRNHPEVHRRKPRPRGVDKTASPAQSPPDLRSKAEKDQARRQRNRASSFASRNRRHTQFKIIAKHMVDVLENGVQPPDFSDNSAIFNFVSTHFQEYTRHFRLDTSPSELEEQVFFLQDRISILEAGKATYTECVSTLEDANKDLQDRLDALKAEKTSLEQALSRVKSERSRLSTTAADQEREILSLRADAASMNKRIRQLTEARDISEIAASLRRT